MERYREGYDTNCGWDISNKKSYKVRSVDGYTIVEISDDLGADTSVFPAYEVIKALYQVCTAAVLELSTDVLANKNN